MDGQISEGYNNLMAGNLYYYGCGTRNEYRPYILAVAGAEKGSPFLLIFDLDLSSFFVIFTSNILSKVMDKYPFNLRIN
jgi:hypothetical protein